MSTTKHKFVCDKCAFKCNYKSSWEKHISTELHKTGKRKKRVDCKEPNKCMQCDYATKNKLTLKIHVLNTHSNLTTRREEFKYYCDDCDFGTFSSKIMNAHNNTNKHMKHIQRKKI